MMLADSAPYLSTCAGHSRGGRRQGVTSAGAHSRKGGSRLSKQKQACLLDRVAGERVAVDVIHSQLVQGQRARLVCGGRSSGGRQGCERWRAPVQVGGGRTPHTSRQGSTAACQHKRSGSARHAPEHRMSMPAISSTAAGDTGGWGRQPSARAIGCRSAGRRSCAAAGAPRCRLRLQLPCTRLCTRCLHPADDTRCLHPPLMRDTMAPSLARVKAPRASVTLSTVGMALRAGARREGGEAGQAETDERRALLQPRMSGAGARSHRVGAHSCATVQLV